MSFARVLLIEPFYGGSHKQMTDLLMRELDGKADLYTLSGKKWHWRARTSSLYFADTIAREHNFRFLFASSVLNFAELLSLRPDLMPLKKIVYFHENQLVYPVRKNKERDFQYGYNQVLTCLVADKVIFNSEYNQESFLSSLKSFFKLMPDNRPKGLEERIRPKCCVLPFPLILPRNFVKSNSSSIPYMQQVQESEENISFEKYPEITNSVVSNGPNESMITNLTGLPLCSTNSLSEDNCSKSLHIVWPHRWEHDKDPDTFFSVIFQLKNEGFSFEISVLGESYNEKPDIFDIAQKELEDYIVNWGYQKSKDDYYSILSRADIAISTAKHEFFGVAMLEAVSCGCYPLCPRKLVYPEIFSDEYLYNTETHLLEKLRKLCLNPSLVRNHNIQIDLRKYEWANLREKYMDLLQNQTEKS